MSDAYGKGIVRGQIENTNLRVYSKENDVTFAECFRTCQTESFYGREFVDVVQCITDHMKPERKAIFCETDVRNRKKKKVTFRDVAMLYAYRPSHPEMFEMSPYEFVTHWEVKLLKYPLTLHEDAAGDCHAQ